MAQVEVAPDKIIGVRLTVYEDSDPERLAKLFAEKYSMPTAAAVRLQVPPRPPSPPSNAPACIAGLAGEVSWRGCASSVAAVTYQPTPTPV